MRRALRLILELLLPAFLLAMALTLRLPYQAGLTATDDFFYAHLAASGARQDLHFQKYISEASEGHIWPYPFRFPVWIPVSVFIYFFGISDQIATLWPLLASLLSILAVYLTARLLAGPTAGLISGLILAALPSDVLHSSLLVPESTANLFLILSTGAFLSAWKTHRSEIHFGSSFLYFCSGVFLALGIWSREYLLFIAPVFVFLIAADLLNATLKERKLAVNPNLFWTIPGFLSAYLPFEIFLHQQTGEWNYRWHLIRLMAADWREAFPLSDLKAQLFFYSRLFVESQTWIATTFLFFLSAPLLIALCLKTKTARIAMGVATFTLIFFLVNEFGSASLRHYEPLHKLERFANLFGPPLALWIGVGMGSFPALAFQNSRLFQIFLSVVILTPLGFLLLPQAERFLPGDKDYQSYAWYRSRLAAFEQKIPKNISTLYVPTVLWDQKRAAYWTGRDEWKQRFWFWNGYRAPETSFLPLYPRQDLEVLSNGLLFADAEWLEQRKVKDLKAPPERWKVLAQNGVGALYEIVPPDSPTNTP